MLLGELTMTEFQKAMRKTRTVIMPLGTVEAHGTHLPLNTDTLIIRELVKRVSERMNVFMLPPLQYGVCTSTSAHPGTIGITTSTLKSILMDIVRDAFGKGLRNFILVSGHGGGLHLSAMRDASETLVGELKGIRLGAFTIYEVLGKEVEAIAETRNDSHAGELETSLVLHLAPRLVKGRAREEYPSFPKPFVVSDKQRYWPGAVWGNPGKASVEKGEALFGLMADKLSELVKKIEKVRS